MTDNYYLHRHIADGIRRYSDHPAADKRVARWVLNAIKNAQHYWLPDGSSTLLRHPHDLDLNPHLTGRHQLPPYMTVSMGKLGYELPYIGKATHQVVQRFAIIADLGKASVRADAMTALGDDIARVTSSAQAFLIFPVDDQTHLSPDLKMGFSASAAIATPSWAYFAVQRNAAIKGHTPFTDEGKAKFLLQCLWFPAGKRGKQAVESVGGEDKAAQIASEYNIEIAACAALVGLLDRDEPGFVTAPRPDGEPDAPPVHIVPSVAI